MARLQATQITGSLKTTSNVGIGTTTLDAKLQVQGSATTSAFLRFGRYSGYAGGIEFRSYTGTGGWDIKTSTIESNANLIFSRSEGTGNFLFGDANVGIGITSPDALLSVNGNAFFSSRVTIKGDAAGNLGNTSGLQLYQNSATDTSYLYNYYNGPMIFGTNNTEKMRISAVGNVGIGTTDPTAKLDIAGSNTNGYSLLLRSGDVLDGTDSVQIAFGYNNTANYRHSIRTRHNSAASAGNNIDFYTWKYGTDSAAALGTQFVMTMQGDGNVGIGTTSPTKLLQVDPGDTYANYPTIQVVSSYADGYDAILSLKNTHTGGRDWSILSTNNSRGTIGGGKLVFQDRTAGTDTAVMTLVTGGNVGIGTTSPSFRLQLGNLTDLSTATPETINLGATYSDTAGSNIKLRIYDNVTATGGIGVSLGQIEVNTWSSGKIAFYRGTTQSAIIDANGNLGVGTSSPTAKLHVYRGAAATNAIAFKASDDTNTLNYIPYTGGGGYNYASIAGASALFNTLGSDWWIGTHNGTAIRFTSDKGLAVYNNVTSGISFYISGSGNVGVNTTSPGTKLEVVGAIRGGLFTIGTTNSGEAWFGRGSDRALGSYTLQLGGTSATNTYFEIVDRAWSKVLFAVSGEAPSDSFFLNTNGNVGIGTSAPSTRLEIADSNKATDSVGNLFVRTTDGQAVNKGGQLSLGGYYSASGIYTFAAISGRKENSTSGNVAGYLSLSTCTSGGTNTERMRINSDGNVGIGTTNPTYKLTVSGDTYLFNGVNKALVVETTVADGNTRDGIYLYEANGQASGRQAISWYNGNSSYYKARIWTQVGSDYAATLFGIDTANDARTVDTRLAIRNGNVGINTVVPATKLDVRYDDGVTSGEHNVLASFSRNGSNGVFIGYRADGSAVTSALIRAADSTPLTLGTTATNQALTILNNGSVGIGSTSPSSLLNIVKTGGDVFRAYYGSGANRSFDIIIDPNNGDSKLTWNTTYSSGYKYYTNNSAARIYSGYGLSFDVAPNGTAGNAITFTTAMFISGSGNVGIGTTTPGELLHVVGSYGTGAQIGSSVSPDGVPSGVWNYLKIVGAASQDAGRGGILLLGGMNDNGSTATTIFGTVAGLKEIDSSGDKKGYLSFRTNSGTATTERLRINSAGNVGIGTSSPTTVLDVRSNNTNGTAPKVSGMTLRTDQDGGLEWHLNQTSTGYVGWVAAARVNSYAGGAWGSGYLEFVTAGASSGAITSTLTLNNGNVGIGTTVPTAYLHIKNGTTSVAPISFTDSSAALLTTVTANKVEYDGNSLYYTSAQTIRGAIERIIYASTSAVTVTSGTDQNLIGTAGQTWMPTIMPANFMVKGRTLRIYAKGTYQGTASDTLSFKFTYGSTFTLYAPNSANAITVSTTNTKQWETSLVLVCTDTTTSTACLFGSRAANAQYGQIMLGDASTTAATTMSVMGWRHNATINTSDTFDNTVANTIGLTCTITAAGSSSGTTVVCTTFMIEVLN